MGYFRPEGYWEPLIGSYLRSADETLLLLLLLVDSTPAYPIGVPVTGPATNVVPSRGGLSGYGYASHWAPAHPPSRETVSYSNNH